MKFFPYLILFLLHLPMTMAAADTQPLVAVLLTVMMAVSLVSYFFFRKKYPSFLALIMALFWYVSIPLIPFLYLLKFYLKILKKIFGIRLPDEPSEDAVICRNCGHKMGYFQRNRLHAGIFANPCEKQGKFCIPME